MLIFAHDVVGDGLGVRGCEALQALVFELDELATDFDLGGAAGRKDKVADMPIGLEHGGDELSGVNNALGRCRGRLGRGIHEP